MNKTSTVTLGQLLLLAVANLVLGGGVTALMLGRPDVGTLLCLCSTSLFVAFRRSGHE